MKQIRNSFERNRRKVFRLRLPSAATLTATIEGEDHEVLEVSELSIWIDSRNVKTVDGICSGTIRWGDGRKSKFTGHSGRARDQGRVIWKIKGISMKDIVSEQRRLISRFPLHRGERRA